jgi:hypothetical protein
LQDEKQEEKEEEKKIKTRKNEKVLSEIKRQ